MPPQRKRHAPKITPDSVPAKSETLPGDLRREDQNDITPDSLPKSSNEQLPVAGHSLAPDGGNEDHPIHDSEDDMTPGEAAREVERTEAAARER